MLLRTIALALLCLPFAPPTFAARPEVAVIKSDDLGPYDRLVAGFSSQTRADLVEYSLKNDPQRAEKVFRKVMATPPAAILAVGALAATQAKKWIKEVPIVFVMVPSHERLGLAGSNVTGISLVVPMRLQLEALKAIAPRTKAVGVLFNPDLSQAAIEQATVAARELGVAVVPAKIQAAEDVPAATKGLTGKVDAIWMIPDRTVASVDAFKAALAFSLKEKLPMFAFGEEQVREGALVAMTSDYTAIGQQAGRLVDRLLREGVSAGNIPIAAPEGLDIFLNLTTARRVAVECDVALEVLKLASKKNFPLKVFQ